MKRFVEIEYHDYMDLKSNTEVRAFEGTDEESLEKNVNDFVTHMKSFTKNFNLLNKKRYED